MYFIIIFYNILNSDICAGSETVNSSGTIILSPGYPNQNYPSSQNCDVEIRFDVGKAVVFDFLEDFDIEAHRTCFYDYIEIFDGIEENSLSIAKLCGSTKPEKLETNNNTARMIFHSDTSVTRKGFSVKVSQKDREDGKYYQILYKLVTEY